MSYFSRFNSKKPQQEDKNQTRNYGSLGPVKVNTQTQQNQNKYTLNNAVSNGGIGASLNTMYVISTDMNDSSFMQGKAKPNQGNQRREVDNLKEQIVNLEANLKINKEIIQSMMESQNSQMSNQSLNTVLKGLQKENQILQDNSTRLSKEKNDTVQALQKKEEEFNASKSKIQALEKQISDFKNLILHKDNQAQIREQIYNDVLQLCARVCKNDKNIMGKLRDLKQQYADACPTQGSERGGGKAVIQSPEGGQINEALVATTVIHENQQLKKDLEFANKEVDRLRAKLVVDDEDVPSLIELLQKSNNEEQVKSSGDLSLLKKSLIAKDRDCQSESRNGNTGKGSLNISLSMNSNSGQVPKLDFKKLKKVQEFKDWYQYSSKLEDSIKFLRFRVKQLEEDNDLLNQKYRKEQQQKENLFSLNEKLNKALKKANTKIIDIKDKYKQKVSKKCYYCNNDLELSMNIGTTLDPVNISQLDQSFSLSNKSRVYEDKDDEGLEDKEGGSNMILENLFVSENLQQLDADKIRQNFLRNKNYSTKSEAYKTHKMPEDSPKVLVRNDHLANSRNQLQEKKANQQKKEFLQGILSHNNSIPVRSMTHNK